MAGIPEPERDENHIVQLNEGHWIEALHATHMLACIFDDHVLEHPAVVQTSELKEKAEAISFAIGELYQAIGRRAG